MSLFNLSNSKQLIKDPENQQNFENWIKPANSPIFNTKTYFQFEYLVYSVPRKYWNDQSTYHNNFDKAFAQSIYPRYFEELDCKRRIN